MILWYFKDKPNQLKSKKRIDEKKNVRIAIQNKLGPVRHTQQIQANTHKYILGAFVKYVIDVK